MRSIPGVPGKDYPIMSNQNLMSLVKNSRFSCEDKSFGGKFTFHLCLLMNCFEKEKNMFVNQGIMWNPLRAAVKCSMFVQHKSEDSTRCFTLFSVPMEQSLIKTLKYVIGGLM